MVEHKEDSADQVPILKLVEVTKRYGEVIALDHVSLEVYGGIWGLLGANGAGKSTLFRALLDLVRPQQGSLEICGLDVVRQGVEARQKVGYLPEDLQLYDRLTGWEHVEFVAGLRGLDNVAERQRMFQEFGLWEARGLPVGEYSLGMRKKTGLIAALMGAPRLAILDEPLNGLDTESMRDLRQRIQSMAKAGTTFVISSHVMAFVERVCDRVAILKRGRLIAQGTPLEIRHRLGMTDQDVPFEDVFLELAL